MPKPILQALGRRIRNIREAKGFSQERLAELTGLHRTYIGGVERGERNLGFLNLVTIARALGIALNKLLEGIEDEFTL